MGSPLSPIIADIIMQDLENFTLNALNLDLIFYARYVDDIALAAPTDKIDIILDKFNAYHDRLKFTLEYESNGCLNFLDLKEWTMMSLLLTGFIKKLSRGDTYHFILLILFVIR